MRISELIKKIAPDKWALWGAGVVGFIIGYYVDKPEVMVHEVTSIVDSFTPPESKKSLELQFYSGDAEFHVKCADNANAQTCTLTSNAKGNIR